MISRTTAVALAMLHMGLEGVIIGYITGSVAALITALAFIRGKLPKPTHNASLKPILKFSLPLLLSSLTVLILSQADVVIITALTLDYSLTGVYYIALNSVTSSPSSGSQSQPRYFQRFQPNTASKNQKT